VTQQQALIEYLTEFISPARKLRFDEVIAERMSHMCIVLEDIYQAHNASAVLRSCDCFGIQDVHFIENRNKYKISEDVAMGSSNWLSIHRYADKENNTVDCLRTLKSKGYKIIATTPHKNDFVLSELPVSEKFALVFGTEIDGISSEAVSEADAFVKIPMYGFTESFNISVCAALCMYELSSKIRAGVKNYRLNEEERNTIYLEWLKRSVPKSELIVKEFEKKMAGRR
jgi:tRNA (guanosine-2'-O-)-methyltransferase